MSIKSSFNKPYKFEEELEQDAGNKRRKRNFDKESFS